MITIQSLTRTSREILRRAVFCCRSQKSVLEELEKEVESAKVGLTLLNQNTSFDLSIDAKKGVTFSITAEKVTVM